jgi:hypothetical protein
MAATNFEQLILQADHLLRGGQGQRVAELVASLQLSKIPRPYRLPMADICRRAGLIYEGLRILSFVVDADSTDGAPTSPEMAGYAALLQKNSSLNEAMQMLKQVDPSVAPESLLYRAFCHFGRWEYQESISVLESYRDLCASPYARLVACVNLASALVATENWESALIQIENNIRNAEELQARRLIGNSLEMRAQYHLHTANFQAAQADLEQALSYIGGELTSDQLFILKWRAVLASTRTGDISPLQDFKKAALDRRHFESVREADFHALKCRFDENQFRYLYFGTPFKSYRRKILKYLGAAPLPEKWSLGAGKDYSLDLQTGTTTPAHLFTPGDKIHQILSSLWRDFYQPVRLGTLFADLFPEERFNPWTSPNRVHQLLRRTRRQLESAGFPIQINDENNAYKISAAPSVQVLLAAERGPVGRDQILIRKLREALGENYFSASEAQNILQTSSATVHRLLRRGVDDGLLHSAGHGPGRRYSIAS